MTATNGFPGMLPQHLVKICGLRTAEHAVAAAVAGADLLGFNFAQTRRYVDPEVARTAIEQARAAAPGQVVAVGVFVNAGVSEMNAVADRVGLDLVQLSGDEPVEVVSRIERPVIRALRPGSGNLPADIVASLRNDHQPGVLAYLIDGYLPGHFGGTGVLADWGLAVEIARSVPIILAGGLNAANVAGAIAATSPIGVDVSSSVERDGVKDADLIHAFVGAAKSGFSQLSERR